MMNGNPPGNYMTPEWVDALVIALLDEIERVYWNTHQEQWERYQEPNIKGLHFRAYYWGDDEVEAAKPNLKFDFSEQDIRWYKHPGRSMSFSVEFTDREWIEWFQEGLRVIRASDKRDWE